MQIFETQDGSHTILSKDTDVSYHSRYGAVQESRHVFIESGLFYKSIVKKELSILEMGFGTGLNAFLTFIEAETLQLSIRYTAVEAFPVSLNLAAQLNYPVIVDTAHFSEDFIRLHQAPWGTETQMASRFFLLKLEKDIQELVLDEQFDLIYYDAFAPGVQPQLWEAPVLQKMYDALVPGGIFVTYCAKGSFKRALRSVGFKVEALKGPPGKREITRAIKM